MNERLHALTESVTLRVADRVRALEAAGQRVLRLQTGDPDFATHPAVVERALQALREGETHYGPTRGLPALRTAIADRWQARHGLLVDPQREVLVTQGGVHALLCAVLALVNPGDEVLIEEPFWMPYRGATILAGGLPVPFAADAERNFAFRLDRLEAALTPRSRVLILNSPGNPSGRVLDAADWAEVARVVREHDLWLISDEVYEALVYGPAVHLPAAAVADLRARTVTVGSLSKTFAMTGWRVGYAVAPAAVIDQMLKVSQYSITHVAPFIQWGAVAALTRPEVADYEARMRAVYADRRDQLLAGFPGWSRLRAHRPAGAFYLLVDVRASGVPSEAFADRLLDEARVAVVPGRGFGAAAEGFVRVTFAAELAQVQEGLTRMNEAMGRWAGGA